MGRTVALVVEGKVDRPRLDRFLTQHLPDESRASIQRLIHEGHVQGQDGPILKPATRLHAGDRIRVQIPEPAPSHLVPEDIPLNVVHEDSDLLVIEKPAGMVMHPGAGVSSGTVAHALLGLQGTWSGFGGRDRPGIVHRLDKDTTGLLVVARNDRTHRLLAKQFATRRVRKAYRALVWGHPAPAAGVIRKEMGRHPRSRTRMAVRPAGGREAITSYRTEEVLERFSLLEVSPLTGRTHQIRVHLQSEGHPILGDKRYGKTGFQRVASLPVREALRAFGRMALHAAELTFVHPGTAEELHFRAPLPSDFERLLQDLRNLR